MQIPETSSSYENFINAINSEYTKLSYSNGMKMYIEFHNITDYDDLVKIDKQTTNKMILKFVMHQRNVRKLSLSRINVCFSALKLFYDMNDYELNWSRLSKFKGKDRRRTVHDRTYTKDEIQKMLQHADLRMKAIILTMLSSGVRTGGLAGLKLKDLTYIENYKLYRIVVYSDYPSDSYYTFCTPETASIIQMYLEYRQTQGENLTPRSPLIRQKFDSTTNIEMTSEDIQERMRCLLIKIGMSPPKTRMRDYPNESALTKEELIERKRNRHEVMRCHGLRKYFDTICIDSDMKNIPKELLMGHKMNLGMDRHYYRPTSDKLLNEYLKVVDALTINDEHRLSKKVQELQEKNQDKDYMIKGKLQEKDNEIKGMKEQINEMNKKFEQVFSLIQQNPDLVQVKPGVLISKNKV
jgi:integrase